MKWIHVECLNKWRRASKKESRYRSLVNQPLLIEAFFGVMNVDMSTHFESILPTFLPPDV